MGYWENTAYVAHGEVSDVAEALAQLLAAEGMRAVPRPPRRTPERYDPLQYEGGAANARWAIALFPGAPGWTVVKTAPLELLAETPVGGARMRWVDLCARLGAPGFQLHVYDSTGGVLAETDGRGALVLSGVATHSVDDDPLSFHGHPLQEERLALRFDFLPLDREIAACTRSHGGVELVDLDAFAARIAKTCGGSHAEHCDNLTIVGKLVPHLPLAIPDGRDMYFERGGGGRA